MKPSASTSVSEVNGGVRDVVIPADEIARRVEELAREITRECQGRELTILAVLTGSLVFLADLVRHLPLMVRVEIVSVRSYPDDATESQGPRFRLPPDEGITGRDVLILDDILDSGATLSLLCDTLGAMQPASLRTCVLLRKNRDDLPDRMDADFAGFDIEHEFVVGYGLDYDNLYRNLPDICVLKHEIVSPQTRAEQ